jgi:hypothetical protein
MRNQCDGCLRGLPVENGIHREPTGGMGMGCSAGKYLDTKLTAVTISVNGRSNTVFIQAPTNKMGQVTLSPDAFNRLVERATGRKLERGTTISYG